MSKRLVIVHFHLFKNAGTSVDTILQRNFEERWIEIEGPNNRKLDPEALIAFIRDNPQYDAISSHTAVVSVPEYEDIEIIPILFFRHPIDRIRSAYDFERKQDAQTPGSIKAKEGDFKYYMDWRMTTPNPWQVCNFHAFRLKDFHDFTPAKQTQLFEPRARAALESLPFVGLVEEFDHSMTVFQGLIQSAFPEFQSSSVYENVTAKGRDISENIDRFADRIGEETFEALLELNRTDMRLYEMVKSRNSDNEAQ